MAYIEIHADTSLYLEDQLPTTVETSRCRASWYERLTIYGPDGHKLRVELSSPRPSFATRLLGLIYDPVIALPATYVRDGTYGIQELKDRFVECLDRDDDILTQFHEYEEIKSRLDRDETFEDVVATIRWMHEEDHGD